MVMCPVCKFARTGPEIDVPRWPAANATGICMGFPSGRPTGPSGVQPASGEHSAVGNPALGAGSPWLPAAGETSFCGQALTRMAGRMKRQVWTSRSFIGCAMDAGVFRRTGTCASSDGRRHQPVPSCSTMWCFETSEYRQGSGMCPTGRMGDGIDLAPISTSSILAAGSILGTAASRAFV